MATARSHSDPRVAAQAAVLKGWGQAWRRSRGASQQDLGRAAGYGSDASPKSAAVAISRIESGRTEPAGRYRQQLLAALGHSEDELQQAVAARTDGSRAGALARALAGPVAFENQVRRSQIVSASNALTQRVTFQSETAEQVFARVRDHFVLPFLDTATSIDWPPAADVGGPRRARDGIRTLRDETRGTVLRAFDDPGARRASAAAVLAALSASAGAATSAAIASLSGATSATAVAHGGSIGRAGGLGLAAGTAALAGMAALPALLAVGGVLAWRGARLRREAEAEVEKLDAAQEALEDMADAVAQAEVWTEAQQRVIQHAGLVGQAIHARLVAPALRPVGAGARTPWVLLSEPVREALAVGLELVAVVLDAHALPVWLGVANVGQPDPGGEQQHRAARSAEWVGESLAVATADVADDERWLRTRLSTAD